MFAAAATVAQMVFDASLAAARWLATKALMLGIIMLVLPWVLKGFFIWGIDYMLSFAKTISGFLMTQLSQMTQGSYDFSLPLHGVGGYLAIQTGLIDYCTIIFTGWGVYWFVAIFPRRSLLPTL